MIDLACIQDLIAWIERTENCRLQYQMRNGHWFAVGNLPKVQRKNRRMLCAHLKGWERTPHSSGRVKGEACPKCARAYPIVKEAMETHLAIQQLERSVQ